MFNLINMIVPKLEYAGEVSEGNAKEVSKTAGNSTDASSI